MVYGGTEASRGSTRGPHGGAGQLGEALGHAVAHDDEAQVGQRVLVKELADEALQHARHHRQPVGSHVAYGGRP